MIIKANLSSQIMSNKDPYSDQYLKKRDIYDLITDENEVRIGKFLAEEYDSKLSEINANTYAQTCLRISELIKIGVDSNRYSLDNTHRCRSMLNIARSGLNDFYKRHYDPRYERFTDDVDLLFLAADLHYYCAIGVYKCYRPFDALEHIQFSIRYGIELRKHLEPNTEKKSGLNRRIMDSMSKYTLMESTILTEIMGHVDRRFKKKIAYYVYYSQILVSKYYSDEGMVTEYKEIFDKAEAFRSNMLNIGLDLKDKDYHDILFSDDYPDMKVYEEWCWGEYFCLNPTNDLPILDEPDYKDTLKIQLDEINLIRLNDILWTFDHCRRIMFWFYHLPEEDKYDCKGEPIQRLLDCYFRLYSTLDKIAKILYDLIIRNNCKIKVKDRSFKDVAKYLENDSNDYIKGIYQISKDINYTDLDN